MSCYLLTSDRNLTLTSERRSDVSSLVEELQSVRIDLDVESCFLFFDEEGFSDSSFQPIGVISSENAEL